MSTASPRARAAWHVVKARLALRWRGVETGARVRVTGRRPVIRNEGRMSIGERVRIHGRQYPVGLSTGPDGSLDIGRRVLLNQGCTIHAAKHVEIGDDSMLSDLVAVYDTDFHAVDEGGLPRVEHVSIGANVWIGRGAIVLPGVTIGDHAVIGAGAVVVGDVPARAVFAGNPAQAVREVRASQGFRRS